MLASLALAAGAAGCGGDDDGNSGSDGAAATEERTSPMESGAAPATGDKVSIVDFKFMPAEIRVKKGTKLTFSNDDTAAHTATAMDRSFDTDGLQRGEKGSVTLDKPGRIAYICDFHPFMKGTVVVE